MTTCGHTNERSGPALATGGRLTNELRFDEVKRADEGTVVPRTVKEKSKVPSIVASSRSASSPITIGDSVPELWVRKPGVICWSLVPPLRKALISAGVPSGITIWGPFFVTAMGPWITTQGVCTGNDAALPPTVNG